MRTEADLCFVFIYIEEKTFSGNIRKYCPEKNTSSREVRMLSGCSEYKGRDGG